MALDHERRTQARIRPDRPIFVDYPEQRPRIRDISLSGAFIEDTRPLPRGRMLQVRLWLSEKDVLTAQAMVRRSEEGKGMGVEFLAMSDEDRNRLREFVGVSAAAERLQFY